MKLKGCIGFTLSVCSFICLSVEVIYMNKMWNQYRKIYSWKHFQLIITPTSEAEGVYWIHLVHLFVYLFVEVIYMAIISYPIMNEFEHNFSESLW
jgi:hypothetical protein